MAFNAARNVHLQFLMGHFYAPVDMVLHLLTKITHSAIACQVLRYPSLLLLSSPPELYSRCRHKTSSYDSYRPYKTC